MARKQNRELRRGDGYITERTNRDGSFSAQARWEENRAWRAKSFRINMPDDVSESELEHLRERVRHEAADFLRKNGRDRRAGRYVPESSMTLNDALAGYMERGGRRWKQNTLNTYRGVITLHIAPYIGKVRLADLTPLRVQTWVDDLIRKGLSGSMIENARIVLNGACKDAVRLGVIPHNPVSGAALPARVKRRHTVWTAEQARKVLALCADDLRMHTYYVVALTTAMRPGEIRALKWSDVNLEKSILTVQRTITKDARGRQVIGTTTKTGRVRTIALPPSTVSSLRKLRLDQNERRLKAHRWADLDMVFDRGDGNLVAQNTVARAHQRYAAEAGVPIIRMHDLRHTAATLLLEAGTHVKIVSDLLGHSQIATTLGIYTHVSMEVQSGATQALADVLDRHA